MQVKEMSELREPKKQVFGRVYFAQFCSKDASLLCIENDL